MTEEMRKEIANRILAMKDDTDVGEIDDGYHTFNELYEHRHRVAWISKQTRVINYTGMQITPCGVHRVR